MKGELLHIRLKVKFLFDLLTSDDLKAKLLRAIPFWIASFITGLVAVLFAKLFGYSEDLLQRILSWHSWLIFILAPLCFVLAWLVVHFFAPNAKGSGIPQVMAAIDLDTPKSKHKISSLLSIRIIFTKVISSLLMVLGGGAIGREGPTIQIAGSIFYLVHKYVPKSWPKLSSKSFVLTGAAAGLAAAFNTPLGGIVFAIEELARVHVSLFRSALFTAVIIAGLSAEALLGPYLYLGHPDVQGLDKYIFISVIATAVISGLLSSFMCRIILNLRSWKNTLNNFQTFLFVIIVGLITAIISYFLHGQITGSGKDLIIDTLFSSDKHIPLETVLYRILGPILSFNTGAAGGVFAPSLAAGASAGAFLAGFFGMIGANANLLILSGMVGFLTGVTRSPFTSAILVLEMTDRHSVIFHLMLAAMIAHFAALLIDKDSLYEQLKKEYVDQIDHQQNRY